MHLHSTQSHQKGFTLVELLVVIGMIAGLTSISSVIILRQIDSGNDVKAAVMAQQFALISEKWEEDFYFYPHGDATPNSPEFDEVYLSDDQQFMANVLGTNASVNQDMINYLESFAVVDDGEGGGITLANVNGNPSGGGGGNAVSKALVDPWGNPFIIGFDHDLNGDIEAPAQKNNEAFLGAYAGEIWRNTSMVIISAGRNGLFDKDKDIVYKY